MILLPIILYSGYIFSCYNSCTSIIFVFSIFLSLYFDTYLYKISFCTFERINSCRLTCKTTGKILSLFVNRLDQQYTDGMGMTFDKNDIIFKPDMSLAEKSRRLFPPFPPPHSILSRPFQTSFIIIVVQTKTSRKNYNDSACD